MPDLDAVNAFVCESEEDIWPDYLPSCVIQILPSNPTCSSARENEGFLILLPFSLSGQAPLLLQSQRCWP